MKGWGCIATVRPREGSSERVSLFHKDLPLPLLLPPRTSWKKPEPLWSELRLQKPLTALLSQMLALDADVKLEELRSGSAVTGVGLYRKRLSPESWG